MTVEESILSGLNPQQREAVTTTEGPVLIVAGPGSGKTRVLTHRIAYLLAVRHVDPHHILAVTFTNKAAKEMRDRMERIVGPQVNGLTVGTFHAFCARVLRRDGERIGIERDFTIYDDADQINTMKQALRDLNLDAKQYGPRTILSTISAAKSNGVTASEFAGLASSYWEEVAGRVYPVYQGLLRRHNALDFDDLLLSTLQLLNIHADVLERYQHRYRYIHVDEYQDTNHVQYRLVKELAAAHQNLCVVGDPD
jgi:DNA helicase II / ATP-dependent DNA helicase PcrA